MTDEINHPENDENNQRESVTVTEKPKKNSSKISKKFSAVLLIILAILLIPLSYAGYVYASTPAVIRKPLLEHYHFRLQVRVNGKSENFADSKYQTGYSKDNCNADLPSQPLHFHDSKDQFVHVHWEGMTGGLWMKYYGWNYVGGPDNMLGYKLDPASKPTKVPIHGNTLPNVPDDAKFYVYTGDENGYQEKSFDDWKNKDIEDFLGKTSNFPAHELNKQKRSVFDNMFPKAYAHNGEDHSTSSGNETNEERLTRLNNLLGNVVIFVQKDKPSDQQIKDRFNHLEPLSDSTCGG